MSIKKLFFIYILFQFNLLPSQEYVGEISPSSKAYHKYITQLSVPGYNIKKIRSMISGLQPTYMVEEEVKLVEEVTNADYYLALPEKDFQKLSSKEKFTYTMIHPEFMSQVCAEEILIEDEDKKIPGYLAFTLDEATWSDRQLNFLKSERKEVIGWIKEYSQKDGHIGLNYKKALEEINAVESIPFLINFYKNIDKKDKDILALLLTLIKKSRYYPFIRSNMHRDLYQNEDSVYRSYIEYTPLAEEYIIKTAENFCKGSGIR